MGTPTTSWGPSAVPITCQLTSPDETRRRVSSSSSETGPADAVPATITTRRPLADSDSKTVSSGSDARPSRACTASASAWATVWSRRWSTKLRRAIW